MDQVLSATNGEYVWVVWDAAQRYSVRRRMEGHGWAARMHDRLVRGDARIHVVCLSSGSWNYQIAGLRVRGWCASCEVPSDLAAELGRRVEVARG